MSEYDARQILEIPSCLCQNFYVIRRCYDISKNILAVFQFLSFKILYLFNFISSSLFNVSSSVSLMTRSIFTLSKIRTATNVSTYIKILVITF